ncbi:MAG: two-component system response regulator, partial [Pseudanabaena sp.]
WGMKQGASAYLTKPVDVTELIRTIKLLVKD